MRASVAYGAHSPTTSSKPSPRDAEHVEIALPVSAWMDEVRSEAKAEFFDAEGDTLCGCGNVDLVQALLNNREILRRALRSRSGHCAAADHVYCAPHCFLRGRHMSNNLGLWIGFSFAGLCVLGIIYAALAMKAPADVSPRQLNLVILIAGGLVGWVVGMLITPISPKEQAVFSDAGKALSTFVAGYLVAKIDRLFDIATKQNENVNGLLVGRLLMFVSMFALGVLATFVWRSYVHLG